MSCQLRKIGGLVITLSIVIIGVRYHRTGNTRHDSIHALYMIEKWYWNGFWILGIQRMQKELKAEIWTKISEISFQVRRRKWIYKFARISCFSPYRYPESQKLQFKFRI